MATASVRGLEQALSGLPGLKKLSLILHADRKFVTTSLSKLRQVTYMCLTVGLTALECCKAWSCLQNLQLSQNCLAVLPSSLSVGDELGVPDH